MNILTVIELAVSAVCVAVGFAGFISSGKPEEKKRKRRKNLFFALLVFGLWFLVGTLITYIYKCRSALKVEFALFSDRVELFGFSFARTTVVCFVIIAVVLVLSVIFRLFVFPHFDPDNPKGFQNIIELGVEAMDSFARNTLHDYSDTLAPYMFSLGVFMVACAISELLGTRPPTSDITVTLAMGLITFALINYFGIKKKGFSGRIKSMTTPTPVILPMKILSDVAVPVSLACRLFGNMLGGMIVMDLLKSVLGGYASGIPAVAGLYFNVFHPLIQAYIFVILSMTFINEAIE